MRFETKEVERYSIQKGDLLICEGGDAGRCAVWCNSERLLYQNALHRVRFLNEINPFYFMYYFMYLKECKKIDEYIKGVTIKHFTKSALNIIPLFLPPLKEQNRIVYGINNTFRNMDKIMVEL